MSKADVDQNLKCTTSTFLKHFHSGTPKSCSNKEKNPTI